MNWSAEEVAEVPLELVTVMSTVPAVPAGEVTDNESSEFSRMLVPAVEPKWTAVIPARLVPVTLTTVPPPVGPPGGVATVVTPVTVGVAGTNVKWSAARRARCRRRWSP